MENSAEKDSRDSAESQLSSPVSTVINAPKFGYVIPNRVFVGGISSQTTENDLSQLFSNYGNVVNTKIIADRAGVSKGYGFVTFETEEEAKRLQNDAESIVLRDRRLNIAPAIRKQIYQRQYDNLQTVPGSPVPIGQSQLYRQSGIPIFQNGMAFYSAAPVPQPPPPITPVQSPVESPQVYPPGAYGGMPQNTSQTLAFSYPSQNHFYYPAHYPYQIALEGYPIGEGQLTPNNMLLPAGGVESGGVVFSTSPYIIAPQPSSQVNNFFEPSNLPPIAAPNSQEQMTPVFYSSPRGYETPASAFVYTEVPQFPYIPGVRPPYVVQHLNPQHYSSPRRGGMIRPKHNGRGKPTKPGTWYKDNGESAPEEGGVLANALTPPITPRSPHDPVEELPASLQSLNI